ncbi:hypothetical protein PR048_024884 [Dryococelus australis]|uniref:Uncharacterized protein n=1 Tax=Dryococelus australis TaxID=614101 RepID=A0ABQ9GPW9_9NEOP|nr:hypothetical protein PR048_024884 [Dryococelus australis]
MSAQDLVEVPLLTPLCWAKLSSTNLITCNFRIRAYPYITEKLIMTTGRRNLACELRVCRVHIWLHDKAGWVKICWEPAWGTDRRPTCCTLRAVPCAHGATRFPRGKHSAITLQRAAQTTLTCVCKAVSPLRADNVKFFRQLQAVRACSPPNKVIRVKSPAGAFHMWESCRTMQLVGEFSRGSPVSPDLLFQRCSILTSITLIGSQDLKDVFFLCRWSACFPGHLAFPPPLHSGDAPYSHRFTRVDSQDPGAESRLNHSTPRSLQKSRGDFPCTQLLRESPTEVHLSSGPVRLRLAPSPSPGDPDWIPCGATSDLRMRWETWRTLPLADKLAGRFLSCGCTHSFIGRARFWERMALVFDWSLPAAKSSLTAGLQAGKYDPFTVTSNFSEGLLKFYFQAILPPHANEAELSLDNYTTGTTHRIPRWLETVHLAVLSRELPPVCLGFLCKLRCAVKHARNAGLPFSKTNTHAQVETNTWLAAPTDASGPLQQRMSANSLPRRRTGFVPRRGHQILASGNRAGRCRRSAGFSRESPISPAPSFGRCSIFTPNTLIGSQDLTVKSRQNLFTHFTLYYKISLLASHQGEPGSVPEPEATPGFSRARILSDDATGSAGFLGDLPFPPSPLIPALLRTRLDRPPSALKTSQLRAAQISSLIRFTLRLCDSYSETWGVILVHFFACREPTYVGETTKMIGRGHGTKARNGGVQYSRPSTTYRASRRRRRRRCHFTPRLTYCEAAAPPHLWAQNQPAPGAARAPLPDRTSNRTPAAQCHLLCPNTERLFLPHVALIVAHLRRAEELSYAPSKRHICGCTEFLDRSLRAWTPLRLLGGLYVDGTWLSSAVTFPSTNQTRRRLTAAITLPFNPASVHSMSHQSQCSRVLQAPSRTVGFTRRFQTLSSIQAANTSLAVVPQSPVVVHALLHSRTLGQTASFKDCRPLDCGISPKPSCVVAKRIGNSSRREEICDASKSRSCRHSRDSQKDAGIHERIIPRKGEGEVCLRLRRGAVESAPAAAPYNEVAKNLGSVPPHGPSPSLFSVRRGNAGHELVRGSLTRIPRTNEGVPASEIRAPRRAAPNPQTRRSPWYSPEHLSKEISPANSNPRKTFLRE